MIGAGAIGLGTAWHLAQQGHDVSVYDPRLNQSVDREGSANDLSGTSASLGVLMGHVFRRSSGRGWRLRRRSMELWPQWIETLQAHQPDLKLHPGLLQIAEDERAAERMEALAAQRVDLGLQRFDPLRPELHAPAAQPPAPSAAAAKHMAHQHPEGCRCTTEIIC